MIEMPADEANINVYIGYDTRNLGQIKARDVCERSIRKYNQAVQIHSLNRDELCRQGIFTRPHEPGQSTEFTYTRFLVPFLNNYKGIGIFCDSDFLWNRDIATLVKYIDSTKAVACVQHTYTNCPSKTKMDGMEQKWYPRKNWSSLMVFNCSHWHCKTLIPYVVNTATPRYLHRLEWTVDDCTGSIPHTYNYLVGYYNTHKRPAAIHFTDGGPWHKDYINVPFADKWLQYLTDEEKQQWMEGDFWGDKLT